MVGIVVHNETYFGVVLDYWSLYFGGLGYLDSHIYYKYCHYVKLVYVLMIKNAVMVSF